MKIELILYDEINFGQALFGYSDGHRQIAASLKLPSKDLFQLSAASDLASGVMLSPDESYLTGFPLKESRHYALIRTWAASEMPRPGCVWSHVLLVDFKMLGSISDLSVLLDAFRDPRTASHSAYAEPIRITDSPRLQSFGDYHTIVDIMNAYYAHVPLGIDFINQWNLEESIIRIWSQQWPKLRASFSFQTAISIEKRRNETANFDLEFRNHSVRIQPKDPLESEWLRFAAGDAMENTVSPLRRFLWRYGKDIASPRRRFPDLVKTFMETSNRPKLPLSAAQTIFSRFPRPKDALILKRDILGIGTIVSPQLLPVELTDFFSLIATYDVGELEKDEVESRLGKISADEIAPLSQLLSPSHSLLNAWREKIVNRFSEIATEDTLLRDDLDAEVRRIIMASRTDLITNRTVLSLSDDDLMGLILTHRDDDISARISSSVIVRDYGYDCGKLLTAAPIALSTAALHQAAREGLIRNWEQALSRYSSELPISRILENIRSKQQLELAVKLLKISPMSEITPANWVKIIGNCADDISGDSVTILDAFLLLVALLQPSHESWLLISQTLPNLRPFILTAKLPKQAHSLLDDKLPRYYTADWWDLNKRILLTMAKLNKSYPSRETVRSLKLSLEEKNVFDVGLVEEEAPRGFGIWPFG